MTFRRASLRGWMRTLLPAACLAALLFGLLVGSAGAAGLVFSDGFESGNLSQWTASSGMTVQQQVTYAGSWAARAAATGSPAYAYKNFSSPLSELYYDGRFQAISQDSATNASIVRFRTAAVGSILSIVRRGSDSKLSYFNEVTGVTTVGPVITAGSWHELEVHALVNGTSSLVEVWLDGTRVVNKTAESLGATPVGRIYIGDSASGRTFDYAFDNEIVSTSSDVSPPTAPANLTAHVVGSLAVDLAWNAAADDAGVTGYTVYRNGSALATVSGATTYHDATVISGTAYTYTVDAIDAAANHSPRSNAVTITPVSDVQSPTTPSGVTATAVSPTRVDLTWNGSTDNVGVTGYTIYRNGTQLDVTGGATTNYSDTTVSPATQYSYVIDAFDAAANHSSQSSPPSSVTTPSAPANTSAPTISGNAVADETLTADAGQWSGSSPITTTFQWRTCDAGGNSCSNIGGATSQAYTVRQGDIGATLRVAVTASNPYGSAVATSDATAAVTDPGPSTPSNSSLPTISGTAQMSQTLTADPGQWAGSQPIAYDYQWRSCDQNGANCSDILGASSETYTLTVFDVGNTVRVAVTASNSGGSSTAVSARTAVVTDPAPIPPSNTSPPTISGNAVVGQTLTGDNGTWSGTQPLSYADQWRRCDQAGANCSDITGATAQAYTLVSADLGKTIRFVVTASNDAGSSTATSSQTSGVVDSSPPSPPTNLVANAIGPNRVDLGWTASNDNVGVAGYTIYRNGTAIATLSGTTSYSDTTVSPVTAYTYTVDAYDSAQNHSARSTSASVTTPPAGDTSAPTVPTGVTATVITPTRVDLTWTASTDNVGIAGYTIYRNGTVIANVGSASFSDVSVAATTTYTYRVDAFDAAGNHSKAATWPNGRARVAWSPSSRSRTRVPGRRGQRQQEPRHTHTRRSARPAPSSTTTDASR
jgi:fibronectin type 3 domain-containing protein